MSTTSKSPKAVLTAARAVAAEAMPPYAHRFSPRSYTQHQIFACLVLKAFLKTDYRGVTALLADCPELRAAIGLRRVPHYTTLQKASKRLLSAEATTPLLDATVRRFLGRRRRVGIAAADGTGLESRRVSPYFLRRTGREARRTGRYRRFPKLDLICEARTHLVLALCVGQGPRTEVDRFAPLLRAACRRVRVRVATADAGFDSEANHETGRQELGVRTVIPATRGRRTTAPPTGRYRLLMRRRFDRRTYRHRVQVETTFSMMKRRQGSAVHGRSYHSRCRDLRLTVLTHNISLQRQT